MIPAISGAVGPLGAGEWSVGSVGQLGTDAQVGTDAATATTGSFGSALSSALDSLDQSQATATTASQALATGQASDPTQAVTAVENASLEMDLASQLRTKLDDVASNIFQTQA
jgi:flagellar hook-basal body complex protein FliE